MKKLSIVAPFLLFTLACHGSPSAAASTARAQGQAPAATAGPASEVAPPAPKPLVSETTLTELKTLVQKWRDECPAHSSHDADRRADETTEEYNHRMRGLSRALAQWTRNWREIASLDTGLPWSHSKGSKFVRDEKIEFQWQCSVFDVRPWRRGGSEVLCSTDSSSDWSYSVVGELRGRSLHKGDLIEFTKLNTTSANDEQWFKPRLWTYDRYGSDHSIRFKVADGAVAGGSTGPER